MATETVFKSKKSVIYEKIRQEILDGTLQSGTRLIIGDMARRMGVSHIPVREALQQLEGEGLVMIKPFIGATVAEIDEEIVELLFDILAMIEGVTGRKACERLTDEEIEGLRSLLGEMDDCIDDYKLWSEKDTLFHQTIAEKSATTLIPNLFGTIYSHWERLRRQYRLVKTSHNLRDSQRDHAQIIKALKARDAQRVQTLFVEHVRHSKTSYLKDLENMSSRAARKAS